MNCECCGAELDEDQMHTTVECFNYLNQRVEDLELEKRSLEEVNAALKRQLKKYTKEESAFV